MTLIYCLNHSMKGYKEHVNLLTAAAMLKRQKQTILPPQFFIGIASCKCRDWIGEDVQNQRLNRQNTWGSCLCYAYSDRVYKLPKSKSNNGISCFNNNFWNTEQHFQAAANDRFHYWLCFIVINSHCWHVVYRLPTMAVMNDGDTCPHVTRDSWNQSFFFPQ